MATTRRRFLGQLGAAALAAGNPIAKLRPPGAHVYDLMIAGGRVVDAARGPSAVADVAIANGVIARVAPGIPRADAAEVFDARGKLVTPGLIDMHGHVFDGVATSSIDADEVGLVKGVTTIVDAGSAGATNFLGFRKYMIEPKQTRVYAWLNISKIGLLVNNETYIDPRLIDGKAATDMILANRDRILGIKARINGRHEDLATDLTVLKTAREVSAATGVPILLHWTNEPELLALLQAGDVLTHPFNPPSPNSSNLFEDTAERVLPQILELKSRGIWTDFAHGAHLDWELAERAAKQGWYPDTISTDIHRGHVAPAGIVIDLVTTLSKFMYLGLTAEQAIERVTTNPSKILRFPERIGTLAEGSVGDVTVLEVEQGDFELIDTRRVPRVTHQMVRSVAAVKGGRLVRSAAAPGR
ncbi:MAG: twin-arginine translocation signal domain-containing protein [Gemmatimonadetes bacterium]|nr:twin-arginine translocation signal domain-containing protein [Gemmatimonadota bacterium]